VRLDEIKQIAINIVQIFYNYENQTDEHKKIKLEFRSQCPGIRE
jgi:hypothetical protein